MITEGVSDTSFGSSLYVRYANISHTGLYTCRFSSIKGTEERTMFVEVREKPIHAGIIVGIAVVVAIVLVLIVILARRIHQDKVTLIFILKFGSSSSPFRFFFRNAKNFSGLINSTSLTKETQTASIQIYPSMNRPSCYLTTNDGNSRAIASSWVGFRLTIAVFVTIINAKLNFSR